MGVAVSTKDSAEPIGFAFANTKEYSGRRLIPGIRELDREKTQVFNEMEQWCMEYGVRSTDFRGRGVGCIAVRALL